MLFSTVLLPTGCKRDQPEDGAKTVIRITAIPDENPTELLRRYQPMVDYLSSRLGAQIEYIPVTDYSAAVQALVAGKVNFAWLGGFSHVQARRRGDVEPLCMRAMDREFKSVFVAHVDSGVSDMTTLSGKTFAFGSKSSTSGHLMPRHNSTDWPPHSSPSSSLSAPWSSALGGFAASPPVA